MEVQFIKLDCNEHTTGSQSFVLGEMVHSEDLLVSFVGHVSVMVRLCFISKWYSSNRGSEDGVRVALTDESMVQVRPTTFICWPNSLVDFDKMDSCAIKMYDDLLPYFG